MFLKPMFHRTLECSAKQSQCFCEETKLKDKQTCQKPIQCTVSHAEIYQKLLETYGTKSWPRLTESSQKCVWWR